MDDDVKELLGRARPPVRKPAREEHARRDNRYVYNGDPVRSALPATGAPRQNKKAAKRHISTFNTILLLFGGGIVIVLYVHNIITINSLAAEVGRLQTRYEGVQNTNASLRAEVNRKSAWERIGKTATEQLGLSFPTEQPLRIIPDQEALARARGQEQERLNDKTRSTTAARQSDGGQSTHPASR